MSDQKAFQLPLVSDRFWTIETFTDRPFARVIERNKDRVVIRDVIVRLDVAEKILVQLHAVMRS